MDNLSWLHAFVQAAEARSFTMAGRQLGVSPSAIGKSIGRLEERLGVRLFHRSTRSITLTPEGAAFLERCHRILGEIEAAELDIAQTQGAPRGKLRVSLPLLSVVMMPAINGFIRAYPDIQLDLEFTDRLVDVIDEGFDAVIRAGEVTDSRLMSRMLGEFGLILVASPDYLKRRGVPLVPEDLANHACLHHRYATSGTFERWPLRRDGRDIDVMPSSAVIVNTIEPLISMTEQGLGIACLPDLALQHQLADRSLKTVLDAYVDHAGPMRLLWPSSRHPSPKLRAFVDFMGDHLFPAQRNVAQDNPLSHGSRVPTRKRKIRGGSNKRPG
jgi:DNA-binding transcriptional LysR family regulator